MEDKWFLVLNTPGVDIRHVVDGQELTLVEHVNLQTANRIIRAISLHGAMLGALNDALCELDPNCRFNGSNYRGIPTANTRIQTILRLYEVLEQAEGK